MEKTVSDALRGFGFEHIVRLASSGDIGKYKREARLTVLLHEGDL